MARFFFRRLLGMLAAVWVAVTLAFFSIYLVPGDPAEAALSQSTASPDALVHRRAALGLDLPVGEQYLRYLTRLAGGNLGLSWMGDQPVGLLLGQQLPATLRLASAAMAVAVALGLATGLSAALGGDGWTGEIARGLSGLALATPVMFSGTLAIWLFAIVLGVLPATGQGRLATLILPAAVVGLSASGGIARAIDAGVTEALRRPFMLTARAKGLSRVSAMWRHALRVGLLPTLDVVALQLGFLLGGTVVTESVFARQGVGRLLLTAVLNKDLPVVQAVVILSALAYALLNLLADVAHAWFDPRIRLDGSS